MRKRGPTDLTWDEKHPTDYRYFPTDNSKLKAFIKKYDEEIIDAGGGGVSPRKDLEAALLLADKLVNACDVLACSNMLTISKNLRLMALATVKYKEVRNEHKETNR